MKINPWVSESQASKQLCVSETTIRKWCAFGYLKKGTHWRKEVLGGQETILYRVDWCEEEMNYWCAQDARIMDMAA